MRKSLPEITGGQSEGSVQNDPGTAFCFANFRLKSDGSLYRGSALVHLPPKDLAALRLLLANAGQIVTPLQLRQVLWNEVHVSGDSVLKCISSLRARLEPLDCIQTVYKRGYRFFAEVNRQEAVHPGMLPRLAIPPFSTEFGVPEHLGDALAEDAMARLSGASKPIVSIVAQDSVFTLARRGMTGQQIGETLKADLVLRGNLRLLAANFRLRAEMIRVKDGTQMWVEDLLVDRRRMAGLETELVNRIYRRLGAGKPTDSETETQEWPEQGLSISASATPESVSISSRREAYECFVRGHAEWQTLVRHRMLDGLQQLLCAIELDRELTAARIDLAHLCVTAAFYGYMSPALAVSYIRDAVDSLAPFSGSSEALLPILGWINFHFDQDLPAAIEAFSRSEHLPYDPWTTRVRTMFLLGRHQFGEAIDLLQRSIEVDPYSPWLHSRLAWTLHLDGRAEESVSKIRECMTGFPDHEGTGAYGSQILAFNGEVEEAEQLAGGLVQRLPYFDLATAAHAYALACAGNRPEAEAKLERLQWLSRERFVLKSFAPAVYVVLGELDLAVAGLRAAWEDRCPWYFQTLADPRLKPLHGRPDFEELRVATLAMETGSSREPRFNA